MKITVKQLPLLICLVALSSSCIKSVVLDAEAEPKIVVECILDNAKSEQTLHIGYTKGKLEDNYDTLTEVHAILIDKTSDNRIGTFRYDRDCEWTLDYIPEEGHLYRLEISIPGHPEIWSECQMPIPVSFFEIQGSSFTPIFSSTTNPGKNDIDRSLNPSDLPKRLEYTNGICYKYTPFPCQISLSMFSASSLEGERIFIDRLTSDAASSFDTNILEQRYDANDKNYAHMPVRTDFSDRIWLALPYPSTVGRHYYKGNVVFDGNTDDGDGNYFVVTPDISCLNDINGQWNQYLMIECLSDNLLDYNQMIEQIVKKKESTDYTTIFLRDNLPSNINGGIGIFSGKQRQILPWKYDYSLFEEWDMN